MYNILVLRSMQALGHDTKGLDQLDATSCADMFRPCCPSQDPSLIQHTQKVRGHRRMLKVLSRDAFGTGA